MIRKIRGKNLWGVFSEKTGKRLGVYKSRAGAVKRLRQIEYFKKIKKIRGLR